MDRNTNNEEESAPKGFKQSNILPLWGNDRTMNLNPLILTNIQSSSYFKVNLYELKTYHEVVDEIYYKVTHLEPWEKGSRRTSGQTGMCGGVRGVGAGGIVSTAYCLLYKLFTLKLTRKQLNGLLTHCDSPYIRALGFMYIRYALPPASLLEWYEPYLQDEEELDVKAGGGQTMTIGTMLRQWLVKLEWFSTLFPRIPVPIQQKIQKFMAENLPQQVVNTRQEPAKYNERPQKEWARERDNVREDIKKDFLRDDRRERSRDRSPDRKYRDDRRYRDGDYKRDRDRHTKRERSRSPVRSSHSHSGSSKDYKDRHRHRR
ncbi:pre-mRNA-splicing factor 38B [Harmonia axyridis]|uniref:pre-mRNA-splicing factor 38B n=1 Tax=Harmonia axyridis TaxID=115357 RepID=UPI001E279884|nr:pre-mRNA-splicing factor 38B [Harmonia axyridis]XP_045483618.1 pre-mRNA-splicing factor 38B [Harmonia axyridis]